MQKKWGDVLPADDEKQVLLEVNATSFLGQNLHNDIATAVPKGVACITFRN